MSSHSLDQDEDVGKTKENTKKNNTRNNVEYVDDNKDPDESIESVDDYSDDEEVSLFYANALKNKFKRTSPHCKAEAPKTGVSGNIREPRRKCKFKATTKAQLKESMEQKIINVINVSLREITKQI